MRVRHGATLLLALVPAVLLAAPPEAPKEVTVGAGKVKEVEVTPFEGKDFGYRIVGGPAAFREMRPDDSGKRVFWLIPETDQPATIVWWTVGEKASAVTEVNKGAKPAPDVKPTDTFAADLAAAYRLDDDKALTPALAKVFRAGTEVSATAATWGELFAAMTAAADANGVAGKLAVVQKVTAAELKAKLPWKGASDTPIDAAGKVSAKATLTRIATALEGLK